MTKQRLTLGEYYDLEIAYNDVLMHGTCGGKHAVLVSVLKRLGVRASDGPQAVRKAQELLERGY